jgi:hypothetical protein
VASSHLQFVADQFQVLAGLPAEPVVSGLCLVLCEMSNAQELFRCGEGGAGLWISRLVSRALILTPTAPRDLLATIHSVWGVPVWARTPRIQHDGPGRSQERGAGRAQQRAARDQAQLCRSLHKRRRLDPASLSGKGKVGFNLQSTSPLWCENPIPVQVPFQALQANQPAPGWGIRASRCRSAPIPWSSLSPIGQRIVLRVRP